jgi:hypothetical protein
LELGGIYGPFRKNLRSESELIEANELANVTFVRKLNALRHTDDRDVLKRRAVCTY